jgi:squalene-hopene/tetraprenyl-beta-curcumene cyclase
MLKEAVTQFIESYTRLQGRERLRLAYWTQQIFYPFMLVYLTRTKGADRESEIIRKLEHIVSTAQTEDGSFFGLPFPGTMWGILGLSEIGYAPDHPMIDRAVRSLEKYQEPSGELTAVRLPTWDTAWSLLALEYAGISRENYEMRTGTEFLIRSRCSMDPDPHRQVLLGQLGFNHGGWGASPETRWFADNDDTAVAVAALAKTHRKQAKLGEQLLIKTQEEDGGWCAYVKGMGPFGKKPRWRNREEFVQWAPAIFFTDPTTPDITAHALFALGRLGYRPNDAIVRNAVANLVSTQEEDGSWLGFWGWLFIYGTSQVLMALKESGNDMNAPYIRKALDWLKGRQNADGGWGEGENALFTPCAIEDSSSSPVHTAWALTGLIAGGQDPDSPTVSRAISYLVSSQRPDGSWPEEDTLSLLHASRYSNDMHGIYFPLLALSISRTLRSFRTEVVASPR